MRENVIPQSWGSPHHRSITRSRSGTEANSSSFGTTLPFYALWMSQQESIAEVISSPHVHLAENQTLEVVLVRGPARRLQSLATRSSRGRA